MDTSDPILVRKAWLVTLGTLAVSFLVFLNWSLIFANISTPAKIPALGLRALYPHGFMWLIVFFIVRFAISFILRYELAIISLKPFTSVTSFDIPSQNFFDYLVKYLDLLIAFGIFFVIFTIGGTL